MLKLSANSLFYLLESHSDIIRQLHDEIDRSKMSYKEVEAMVHAHMKV